MQLPILVAQSQPQPMRGKVAIGIIVISFSFIFMLLLLGSNTTGDSMAKDKSMTRVPAVFDKSNLGTPFPHFPKPEVKWTNFPPEDVPYRPTELFPKRLRVLITGGAGFIGSQLGWKLHALGHQVILLDNMMFGYWDNLEVDKKTFGQFVLGDVMDPRIAPLFTNVDIVFHFAALSALPVCQSYPRDSMAINVGGVANILELSRQAGVKRFIFASTSAVYENNKDAILTEDLPVNPHLLYSLSKYQSELLVKGMAATNGLDTVILRFFNVYGPHQDFRRKSPPFTSYIIRELVRGKTPVLHSDGKQKRDYVHVEDLMSLASLCMTHEKAKGEIFNVASGDPYSVNEIYDIVAKALNKSHIRPRYQSAAKFWEAYPNLFAGQNPIKMEILEKEVTKQTVGSFEKAKQLLGWSPKVSMKDGLVDMVNYVMKSQKMMMTNGAEVSEKSAWG